MHAAPPDDVDQHVRREVADLVVANHRRGVFPQFMGVALVAVVMWDQIPGTALGVWVVAALLDGARNVVVARAEQRRLDAGGPDAAFERRLVAHLACYGSVYGSLTVIAAASGTERGIWTAFIITMAALALLAVSVTPSTRVFLAAGLPMHVPGAVALLLHGGIGPKLALFEVLFLAVAVKLHSVVNTAVASSIRAKSTNERLAGQLQDFLNDRDPLTSLLNRRGFLARLDELAHEADGDRQRLAVAVGNIQQLAAVNDLYGELVGDQLLVAVAARLSATVPPSSVLARLSGDEFAVAGLVGATDSADGLRTALLRTVGDLFTVDGHRLQVELHVGDHVGDVRRAGELVAEATAAVRQTRARVRPTILRSHDPVARRRDLADQLRRAIEIGDVHPWFQPIVDARTRRLVAWEALVRWEHADGLITPDRFLPLAAVTGLSGMLTDSVLDHALSFCARLRREAPGAATTMHVNFSPSDLRRERIVSVVANSLAGHDVEPASLVVELTEQSVLELDLVTASTMHALRQLGVHIAIDDFGTGFSSLGHLLELPTRHLKIDRRFVAGLPDQRASSTLVQGIVGMARGMELVTVAEGVETEAQAHLLAQLGCTNLQGYLVSPAVPEFEAVALARRLAGAPADEH